MGNFKFGIGLVAVLLVCQNAFSKVDYSKCMKYLSGGGPSSLWDAGITLGNKGEMKLSRASDYQYFLNTDFPTWQEKNSKVTTIERARYSRPDHLGQLIRAAEAGVSLEKLSEMDEKGKPGTKRDIKHIVAFHKDASGNLLGIKYDVAIPRSYKERIRKLDLNQAREYGLHLVPLGATVKFDVKNGQCVPTHFNLNYAESTSSSRLLFYKSIVRTDTKSCRDLYVFFEENTNNGDWKKLAWNDRAIKKVSRILKDGGWEREPIGLGVPPSTGDKDLDERLFKGRGIPLFLGHTRLEGCYKSGLKGVIQDDSIWKDENGSPKSNSRGRGVLK